MRSYLILLFLILFYFNDINAFANTSGLYHDFNVEQSCEDQRIYFDQSGLTNNYKEFVGKIINKLESGGDSCSMSMTLNLQSFIRFLILENKYQDYNLFFQVLDEIYLKEYSLEISQGRRCRLHSNINQDSVESCRSDHIVDIGVLSSRVWFDFFISNLRSQKFQSDLFIAGASGGGVLITAGVLFRSQLKRAGVRVLKRVVAKLRNVFGRNAGVAVRGTALGTSSGVINDNLTSFSDVEIKERMELFQAPLDFISFVEGNEFEDKFGYQGPTLANDMIDLGVVVGAGILPAVLGEMAVLKLAALVPTLSSSLGARIATHAKAFLRSPLAKIIGAVLGGVTVGKFVLTEWNRSQLEKKIAEINGSITALKEEITTGNPNHISTYLMTQELVSLTETLALIYAAPVLAKLESTYAYHSTSAICLPIQAKVIGMPMQELSDIFFKTRKPRYTRRAQTVMSDHPESWYVGVREHMKILASQNKNIEVSSLRDVRPYDLYQGEDAMTIAFKVIVETQNFIESVVGRPEYQSLKFRLYDVAEYLLLYKSPDEFVNKLETAIRTNIIQSERHANPIINFYHAYTSATPPFFNEISVSTWDEHIESMSFYQTVKKQGELGGYTFGCEYAAFPALFNDFSFQKKKIPCSAAKAEEFETCIQR